MTTKLTYTKEETWLTEAELADVKCYSLDEIEEEDEHFFDYLKPTLYCHYEGWHKVTVYSALGVSSTTHTDIFVYSLVLGFTGGSEGACFLSAKEIASLFDYDESIIRKSIKKLLRCKLIKQLPYRIGSPVKVLAAPLNHPAYRIGLSWHKGEIRSRGRALVESDARRAQALQFADILRELALNATENELSLMFSPSGGINYDGLLRLVAEGKSLADMVNSAAHKAADEEALKTASEAAERLSEAVLLPAPNSNPKEAHETSRSAFKPIDIADAPEGYRALIELAAPHNGNKSRWQESLDAYNALVTDGYTPEEILDGYRALSQEFVGVPGKKWPNVYSYLTSTASTSGAKGARGRIDAERERKARETAAAEAAEADRIAREREASQNAEYEAILRQLVDEDAEYQAWTAELQDLYQRLQINAQPGTEAYEARQRIDELAPIQTARFEQLKAEARRRCGIE